MKVRPITSEQHGIIDYIFSGIQLGVPAAIGLNKKVVSTYRVLGIKFFMLNSLTDTPAGISRILSFKSHQKADAAFLAGLTLLSFYKPIRKDRKTLLFHLGFLSTAIAHYALTDYNAGPQKEYEEFMTT